MRLRPICSLLQASVFAGALCFAVVSEAREAAPTAEQIEKAAESFDRGRTAYRNGGYVEAAESFEAADSYASSSAALRLAMLSRARADQLDRALTLAALALGLYPEEAALQKEASDLIARHERSLGRLNVRCDSPCKLLLDNKLVHGAQANERTLYVTAGKHRVRVNWADGHVKNFGVKIEAGASDSLDLLAPTEPVSEEMTNWINSREEVPPEDRAAPDGAAAPAQVADKGTKRGWPKAVFWTGVGLTGAGAVASVALGIRAINEPGADAVREKCMGNTDCPEYQEGLRNQTMANVAIGATAAVGVFTLITGIWLTDWSGKPGAKAARGTFRIGAETEIRPLLGFADGPGLGVSGRF